MAKVSAQARVTTTIDVGEIKRRLNDAERAVLVRWERRLLKKIKTRWINWLYAGRPEGAPVNVSLQAWKSRIETTEGKAVLVIENQARDWRKGTKAYVSYVHRTGETTPEVDLLAEEMGREDIPKMAEDMRREVKKHLDTPARPRRLNARGGGKTIRTPAIEV